MTTDRERMNRLKQNPSKKKRKKTWSTISYQENEITKSISGHKKLREEAPTTLSVKNRF